MVAQDGTGICTDTLFAYIQFHAGTIGTVTCPPLVLILRSYGDWARWRTRSYLDRCTVSLTSIVASSVQYQCSEDH